ncbi:MAG: thiol:disulfide interchange protein DsbA/DsbL [Gammaproteobacteria bacterium]|nr:thiol:disulfide interchange protein DsbA/DsbL [Gammaproteobacteria bacterium]MBV8307033.1 thiol:disulfide interchange protein DsbA/DsbL [Gammaproteobacteria bacterium]
MRIAIALAALLALSACARQQSPAAPAAPPAAAETQTPAAAAPAAPPPAETRSSRSETEQATASQESGDGDGERQARSDASLERIAGGAAGAQLPGGKWQAGVNYEPVVPAQPTGVSPGKVEVLEIFWLACPHCYALEPRIRSWLKSKPAYVEFVRVPVIWQQVHRAHARLFYALEGLGRDDLVEKAFDTIHQDLEKGQAPLVGQTDEETFQLQQQFAVQNGVSADDFSKSYNSFSAGSSLQRAEEITQRYHVQGVPFFVVNGKYSTDVSQAGGEAKLIELINDLAASEHTH